jgi:hypothetical protein
MYFIQHCLICRPSDSTVSEDAGIAPLTDDSQTFMADKILGRKMLKQKEKLMTIALSD